MTVVLAHRRQRRDGQPQCNCYQHRLYVSDGLYMYLGGENSPEQHYKPGAQKEKGNCCQNPEITAHFILLRRKSQIPNTKFYISSLS